MTTLSLLTPSGRLTLGNLLGALRPMADRQQDAYYGISDLHAMTTTHDPVLLRERTREMATLLLAAGLERSTLFLQSAVPAHTALGYLLECTAHTGELSRMVQYKERSMGARGLDPVRVSLYTYPVLMAADILLYRPNEVPVGDDQRQHVELTRDLALRFNRSYGEVFTVPQVVTPAAGARVMDLAEPTRKMSKSVSGPGSILLLDPPDVVRRKVGRAVTDSDTGPDAVRTDRDAKPGVTNLLDVLAACGASAEGLTTYGALKAAVTGAVVAVLEPLQQRYRELADDPAHVTSVFDDGSERCRTVTEPVLDAARSAVGL
jgi:tryptophanyl-tRNA synthetase